MYSSGLMIAFKMMIDGDKIDVQIYILLNRRESIDGAVTCLRAHGSEDDRNYWKSSLVLFY